MKISEILRSERKRDLSIGIKIQTLVLEVTTMKQITNKEYEEWQKYKAEKAKSVRCCRVCRRNIVERKD